MAAEKYHRITTQSVDDDGTLHFYDQTGDEIYPATYPIHARRWVAIAVWMAIFTVVCIVLGIQVRHQVDDLQQTKASVNSLLFTNVRLTKTNFALKSFLLKACRARLESGLREKGKQRTIDLQAARGYKQLADLFVVPSLKSQCNIPDGQK